MPKEALKKTMFAAAQRNTENRPQAKTADGKG